MRTMPETPTWRRADVVAPALGVDKKARLLRGYVVAQQGPFKTPGRGEFDEKALKAIVQLGNRAPRGLKSRFSHATLSDDGPGKHLGRARNFRMDKADIFRDGDWKEVNAVRADLHFDQTSFDTPAGNLGQYVLDLAASDPDAISSSLVLQVDQEFRLERDGTPKRGADGEPLPPLWRPIVLHSSDIVDEGDAVDGVLSGSCGLELDALPDRYVRSATHIVDQLFAGQSPEVIETRLHAWLDRYLKLRFGARATRLSPSPAAASGSAGAESCVRRRSKKELLRMLADVGGPLRRQD